jgi:hypothetical protein
MISAMEQNKCSVIKEDVRTSSIFDNLFLLPDNTIWNIIRNSCYEKNKLPEDAGKMLRDETAFWPSWNSKGTVNNDRVEPDLFIRFERIDVIIEAKLEGNGQKNNQWENECISYDNEYAADGKDIILIALDGISDAKKMEVLKIERRNGKKFRIFKTRWQKLYELVVMERQNVSKSDDLLRSIQIRIFDILIRYFGYFRNYKIVWPNEVLSQNFKPVNYKLNMTTLKQIYENFKEESCNIINCFNGIAKLVNSNNHVANFTGNMKILAKMEKEYGQL